MADGEFKASAGSRSAGKKKEKKPITLKVGLLGDSQIGKTSLMVKYVENQFDETYIETLGVNFMEKGVKLRNNPIVFSIWDLGGQKTFVNMLPIVCKDAVAILFMFDLTRKSTLSSVKEWYRQARGFNKSAVPFLVGTKYDQFADFRKEEQEEITKLARLYASVMRAPLIFCSASASINVQKIFKIVLCKAFDLHCNIAPITGTGEPILEYTNAKPKARKKKSASGTEKKSGSSASSSSSSSSSSASATTPASSSAAAAATASST
mmetsp:Transcript_4125/g.12557  ORF Transcript_4125/g.12557 Transcript_4125/m.12557 type:complete len:265 (-) Transcript_4125:136-930(-)|eukprot:CAMPEP_0174232770 /NCGR_PEP_ID=MMETSP0417-20130205/2969_1 /TAXON_ID=242541 /ORGANISM="Mayorella sp, Strain BSH-02190019" /LENGTH=264 /DNA_ID=CAMNT_0015310875 /DNA_START=337 /DNA_END=1131 /DNA_ORIENTATION=-